MNIDTGGANVSPSRVNERDQVNERESLAEESMIILEIKNKAVTEECQTPNPMMNQIQSKKGSPTIRRDTKNADLDKVQHLQIVVDDS